MDKIIMYILHIPRTTLMAPEIVKAESKLTAPYSAPTVGHLGIS